MFDTETKGAYELNERKTGIGKRQTLTSSWTVRATPALRAASMAFFAAVCAIPSRASSSPYLHSDGRSENVNMKHLQNQSVPTDSPLDHPHSSCIELPPQNDDTLF